ncbi:MAG: DUF4845 domain-containing protein [Gammaproteobacteria bacterium]|nr:MAG: DUF4845 domain-containing protein [Gammaproteobacteria bacterium]
MKQHKQQGVTVLGGLCVLAIAGFIITAGLKIGPLYLDNSFVSAAIDSLADENIHTLTDKQIRRKLSDNFDINNVRDMDMRDVKIIRDKTHTSVTLDYEKRVNFMGNLDVVVKFKNSYDTSK